MAVRVRVRAALGLASACGLLAGCWLQVGYDSGHTRFNGSEHVLTSTNVATLEEAWSADLPAVGSEPMVQGGRVFVQTMQPDEGRASVHAYDVATGTSAWSTDVVDLGRPADISAGAPPILAGKELWAGAGMLTTGPRPIGESGFPFRLDPATGAVLGAETRLAATAPVDASGRVVQVVANLAFTWELTVRDLATRTQLWTAPMPVWPPPNNSQVLPPAVVDGRIFLHDANRLHAFDLSGCGAPTCQPTWTSDLGGWLGQPIAWPGDDEVFVTADNQLLAVARADGAVRWRAPLPAGGRVAMSGEDVYVAAGSELLVFDADGCGASMCAAAWSADLGGLSTTAPVLAGGVAYVGIPSAIKAFAAAGCSDGTCAPLTTIDVAGAPAELSVGSGRVLVVHQAVPTGESDLTVFAPAG